MNRTHRIFGIQFFKSIRFVLVVLIILSDILNNHVSAQTPSALLMLGDTTRYNSTAMLMLEGNGVIGSNVLDIQFFDKSIFGGHLADEHLDRLSGNLKSLNRAGFGATAGLSYFNFTDTLFGNANRGLKVGVHSNYHASLSYGRDVFKLIYRGNNSFRGDSVELGPLSGNYQSWQKFSIGVFNKKTLSSVSLSLVAGDNYQSLILDDANLFTSMQGDSLALGYRGEYLSSDTIKSGWANGSGLGLAVDIDYNLPLADGKGVISVALRDFGFVAWNKQTRHMQFDSTTTWTGLQVNDLFDLDTDSLDLPNLTDSIHRTVKRKSFVAALPMSIHLRYAHYFSKKGYYDFALSIWPNRAALPMLSAGVNYIFTDKLVASARGSFGGYGTWGAGAELQYLPNSNWLIRMGTGNLVGFVSEKANSRDVYFSLCKFFPYKKRMMSDE